MTRIIVFCAALALFACGCQKTFVSREDVPVPSMIADVHDDGPPKITGTGPLLEVRGTATTPWKRAVVGVDAGKLKGATSFVLAAGDRRTGSAPDLAS